MHKYIKRALSGDREFTDDSSAISSIGGDIIFTEGSNLAHKLTTVDDLDRLNV